jgi:hypothetical protein
LVALATIALLVSVMALSWLTRDRWACVAEARHVMRTGLIWPQHFI